MSKLYQPVMRRFSTEQWREMAAAVNLALKLERSRISTRERERLDRIANSKQDSDGRETKHPRYVQIVELGDILFLGFEKIENLELLDRARECSFSYEYFSHEELDFEIDNFCFMLAARAKVLSAAKMTVAQDSTSSRPASPSARANRQTTSEWIVGHIVGIYKRRFNLEPYLGGVGPREEEREPNSPFGVFAKFVLDGLDIRTRNGSRYSLHTIKNCMPAGDIRASQLPDEPELISAREELEAEQSLTRGRGRPKKEKHKGVAG